MKTIQQKTENEFIGRQICKAVEQLEDAFSRQGHLANNSQQVQKNLELLAQFFGVDGTNALLLVPFIQQKIISNRAVDTSKVLEWLKADLSGALSITTRLNKLCIQGLLNRCSDRFSSCDGYILSKKAYMAIINNSPYNLEKEPVERNIFTFIEQAYNLIELSENESFQFEEVCQEIDYLLEEYENLEQIKKIQQIKLSDVELAFLISAISSRLTYGIEKINLDRVMANLNIPTRIRWQLNKSFNTGNSKLLTENIFIYKNEMYKTTNDLALSHNFMLMFSDFNVGKGLKKDIVRGTVIDPACIQSQKLFYNSAEEDEIERLVNLLQQDQYNTVQQELKQQNLSSAITVLFYGKPGTGKTSSVLDIARRTGRMVYKVEVETIKDAFVGESEKNLVQVFEEYKYLLSLQEKHPILLLNEADGLLKDRITGDKNAASEMLNTMTTLLLEKLENFNGILFATVNEPLFDAAFDRRFLIKTELKLPETKTRMNIIRSQFPELESANLTAIVEQYPLTGGQIYNIKRKLAMRKILEPAMDINACIIPLCEQEFVLQQSNALKTINGFRLN